MGNAYIKGKLAPHEHEAHHHVMPISTYLKVFTALLVATVLTVLVSYADLGSAALPIAMFVAVVKCALVIGYFMHLKYDTRFHAFVFLSTILFVAIFFLLTFIDLRTRELMNPAWGNTQYVKDRGAENVVPMATPVMVPGRRPAPVPDPAHGGAHEGGKAEGKGGHAEGAKPEGAKAEGAKPEEAKPAAGH